MGFRLCIDVAMGRYAFRGGVNEVTIKRSIKEIIDTATIKMPAINKVHNIFDGVPLTFAGSSPTDNTIGAVKTSELFKEGDKVLIKLGYNDDRRQEFKGFVRRVSPSTPCLIECEGYAYQLRKKPFTGAWKTVSLKDLLTELIKGTDIKLSDSIPVYTLNNINIPNGNALKALQYIRDKTHLSVFFQFEILYFGLEEAYKGNRVQWRLGWNTRDRNNLKYRLADDTNILVRLVTGKGTNQKRTIIEVGDPNGTLFEENISFIKDQATLKSIANNILNKHKYTGFEGFISCFLQPFCLPGDTAVITDKLYSVRDGSYFIEGIEITFGMDGGIKKVHIGRALSVPNFAK